MYNSKGEQVAGFIRPAIQNRGHPAKVFLTDGRLSQWVRDERIPLIPSGTPGVVGYMVDKMRTPAVYQSNPKPPASIHYEMIAKHMTPEAGAAYRASAEEWFATHPPKEIKELAPPLSLNTAPLFAIYAKYKSKRPPVDEMAEAMRQAGYPETHIERSIKWNEKMDERSEALQKELDLLFAKWPAASKPASKSRKVAIPKKIKAVKKKM